MPNSVIFALAIEGLLIGLTSVLLVQPQLLFKTTPQHFQMWAFRSGWMLLVLLFSWSLLLGRILSDYEISIHF